MAVNESVGAVLDYLQKESLDQSTLVIYMGDNGFASGEHGLIDKRHFYEEWVKVPMLASCPELFAGTRPSPKWRRTRILPHGAGRRGPAALIRYARRSLLPLLQNEAAPWRDKIFYEYYWEYDYPMTPTGNTARKGYARKSSIARNSG